MITLVVDIFVDIVAYLVDNRLDGVIVVIGTSVAVVTSSTLPPISVTGGALEALGLPRIVISPPLGRSDLYKSYIMVTIR